MSLRKRHLPAIFYLAVIVVLAGLNWITFRFFLRTNYFLWYLKSAPLISLAAGFLAPTWTKLKARVGLVSAHPAIYVGACLQVLGIFFLSVRPAGPSTTREQFVPELGDTRLTRTLDAVLYVPILIVMCLLATAWVLLVAPMSYFVTLLSGVPARQFLRGNVATTDLREEGGQIALVDDKQGPGALHVVSFAQDPFSITQALTALILFVANMIYGRFG